MTVRPPRRATIAGSQLDASRIAAALAGALAGCVISAVWSLGPLPILVPAYAGYVLPAVVGEQRAARRRRDAERGTITLVEWLHALVACGRPLETALGSVATRLHGDGLLDHTIAFALRDYTLGVPMATALGRHGRAAELPGLVELAARMERARDLGRGVLPLLQDLRDELRAQERARCLAAASHVEGKLTLVLTLCYLPALALLVIIPLFLTLLAGLFG
jgi:Flp pilus assembly protein TadB